MCDFIFSRAELFVQRMPSSNSNKGTWYESSRASSNWPQYAALSVKITPEQVTVHYLDVCTYMYMYNIYILIVCIFIVLSEQNFRTQCDQHMEHRVAGTWSALTLVGCCLATRGVKGLLWANAGCG